MICVRCKGQMDEFVHIPCLHQICLKCFSQSQKHNQYICELCLNSFPVSQIYIQKKNQQNQPNKIFCWSCMCSLHLQLVLSTHQGHSITYSEDTQAKMKNYLVKEFSKLLLCQEAVEQEVNKWSNNTLYGDYQTLIDSINEFFDRQINELEKKRIICQQNVQKNYVNCREIVQRNVKELKQNYNYIHGMSQTISLYLDNTIQIKALEDLGIFMNLAETIITQIKSNRIQLPKLPIFHSGHLIESQMHLRHRQKIIEIKQPLNQVKVRLVDKLKNRIG